MPLSKHSGFPPKVAAPKKKLMTGGQHTPLNQTKTSAAQRAAERFQKILQTTESRIVKMRNEIKQMEKRRNIMKAEIQRLMKQRDSLKKAYSQLDKLKRRGESDLKKVRNELSKAKTALDLARTEARKLAADKKRIEAELLNARREVESIKKQSEELKKVAEELSVSNSSVKAKVEETVSKLRDLQLTAALSDFFLAADIDGLERWIKEDTPLVLEYMKQVRDRPYFDVYREYLYSRLLKKAYRLYECGNCKKRFRAESGEPVSCPFCGQHELKLINVAKEIVHEPPSSRLVLPRPEEPQVGGQKPPEGGTSGGH
jgi:hypothetical protein